MTFVVKSTNLDVWLSPWDASKKAIFYVLLKKILHLEKKHVISTPAFLSLHFQEKMWLIKMRLGSKIKLQTLTKNYVLAISKLYQQEIPMHQVQQRKNLRASSTTAGKLSWINYVVHKKQKLLETPEPIILFHKNPFLYSDCKEVALTKRRT